MPNDEVKLLPCPLCNAELFHNGGTELGDIYEHPANDCAIQVAWFTATPEWVAKWNRRAIPSTVSGETVHAIANAIEAAYVRGVEWNEENPLDGEYRFKAARDWADKAMNDVGSELNRAMLAASPANPAETQAVEVGK